MKKKKEQKEWSRQIGRKRHAAMPLSLYRSLLVMAKERAFDGDIESGQWLIEELLIRQQEFILEEFRSLRGKIKKDFYGKPCVKCGKPADTIDHIVPVSRGGTNDTSNLQPLCRSCNQHKHDSM